MAATDMATSAEMAEQQSARSGNDLVEGFNNLTLVRQVGLMLGLAASVALGFAVVLWSQETDYRPLYGSLDRLDAVEVANLLETNQIEYKIEPSTGALLVPSDTIHTARLKLAEVGIGTQQAVGFELLDQEMPLGTSQFMENTRYHRGLEGELARTITSINSVRTARVHLAIPKRSVFVRDVRKPTSSVFLEVYPGRDVKPAQVKAIVNLVASSISELQPADVTVVDQRGNLLSTGEENAELVLADKQRRLVAEVEERLLQRVNTILEPVAGSGNFRAQINAQLDFTAIEQAQERYDGEEPQVRSEHTINEVRTDDGVVGGIPGALSNQPPLGAEAPQQIDPLTGNPVGPAPIKHSRENVTRNYEMDRTISYTRRPQGEVSRLSVAVVLDNKRGLDAEGNAVTEPWTEAEIDTLTTLVRDAVGFLEERGDRV